MTNEELLKVIEKAKASGKTKLDLSYNQLTALPPELFQLTSLTELRLNNNQLNDLPPKICQLTNLRELNLSGNKFNSLPPEISQLTNLTYLNLSWNQFTELSPAICQLTKLKGLDFWGNELAKLPIEIGQLTALTYLNLGHNQLNSLPSELFQLTGLTELNLSRNELTTLPPELFQLTELIRLDLNDNKLTALPPEIGQLTCLEKLHLWGNQLSSLPPEIGQLKNLTELPLYHNQLVSLPSTIGQLINLTGLDLSRNLLVAIPPEIGQLTKLKTLNLFKNKLTKLPPEICQLTSLPNLYLNGNKLAYPPLEVARKGIEAIREYLAALEKGKQRLNEVKIILVGEGEAGKTSLVRGLQGLPYNPDEDTTYGINIQGWVQKVDGQKIRINIWDFGGQVIQHATHQFFLSKRSLYILVLDGRKEERAEYWLQHIKAFGGDSPILVVLNKHDKNPSFDVNRLFLREKYPSIREFFSTSCKTGKGIADFRKALLEELAKVEILETVWPESWFAVKHKLEEMDKPYIGSEEYGSICKVAGITEEESRDTLVDFLHDLGVAVHFKDFILDAMHVLDPVWVTNAVYKIITAEKMADSKGVLRLKHLEKILPQSNDEKHSYPVHTHVFLLELMEKFELCYPVGEEAVLIPQLLPVPEPKFTFDYSGSLRFTLHYPDFLPPSVFPRFMVKVYKEIKDKLRWRTGVVLHDKQSGVHAVIKADIEARRINLWVHGERRREYLHYLRYLLADINSSFEKLAGSERVPMPDDPVRTADYETLRKYAKEDINYYIPEGSDKKYSVHELLGLVQPKDRYELENFVQKVREKPDEKLSPVELLNELVEPKITVLGITFNLKRFFDKVLTRQKQKQQQSRK